MNILKAHPRLVTFGIAFGITFVIGTAIGMVDQQQVFAKIEDQSTLIIP
jgi:hypothetical protein